MKIRSIFLGALAALTLAACSKGGEKGIDSDGPDIDGVTGEQTYTTFTISLANADSKAFHGNTQPTTAEQPNYPLSLYIYNVEKQIVEEVLTFTTSDPLSKTVLITTGPKIFAATAGMPAVYTAGAPVTNFSNYIVNVADEAAFSSTLTVANSFWMASELVSHTVVSATENEAQTPGHHNNITIKLGRSMAKIGVYYDENIEIKDGNANNAPVLGTMSDVEYKIKNNPDQMYMFTTYDASGVWKTPYFNRNNNIWSDMHANNYWDQQSWHDTGLDASLNHKEPTYMMENSNMTARHGNATYAAIKGVFSPSKWYDKDGNDATSGTWNAGDPFWRIASSVTYESDGTTVKEVLAWKDNRIYNEDPVNVVNGAEEAIKYEDGVMYYYIYLDSSLGNTPPALTADKYSQHRNQYWDVEITKVTNLGWNYEDGGRPDNPEPLDPDSYIHVTIQVLNWEGVYMPGEL